MNQSVILVQIQHCQNCHLHSWCSRHDEKRYIEHAEKVRASAFSIFNNLDFKVNEPQSHLQNISDHSIQGQTKYLDSVRKQIVHFPRFGSFQIFVNGILIFSKLQSNLWPKHDRIALLFEKIKGQIQENNNFSKYSLQYRLQNDSDQYFRDTYKKVIEKIQAPRSKFLRPYSQNPSDIVSNTFHSPSNQFSKVNTHFISRKLHQSVKKNPFTEYQPKYGFTKPQKPQNRLGSKSLKRPMTNQAGRTKRSPIALEFNKNFQNFEIDAQEAKKNQKEIDIKLKGSPNPRRRLQLIRDATSKPEHNKNNLNTFGGSKEYLNLKARMNGSQPNGLMEPSKKIANLEKLSPKLSNSHVNPKISNWIPIKNPIVEKKQEPEKAFKKISLKNQKLKNTGTFSLSQKQKLSSENDSMMQKSQQRLIAQLQKSDSKSLKGETIKSSTSPKQNKQKTSKSTPNHQVKKKSESDQVQIEQKDSIMSEDQQQQKETPQTQSKKIIKIDVVISAENKDKQKNKGNNDSFASYKEQWEENTDLLASQKQKEECKLNDPENLVFTKNSVQQQPAELNSQQKQVSLSKQSNSSQKLLPKHNFASQNIVLDTEQMQEHQYENQFNDQEEQTQDQVKLSNEQIPDEEQDQLNEISDDDRKKSTSIENSLSFKIKNQQSQSIDTVKQNQFRKAKTEQYHQNSEINPWSKKNIGLSEGPQQQLSFKINSDKDHQFQSHHKKKVDNQKHQELSLEQQYQKQFQQNIQEDEEEDSQQKYAQQEKKSDIKQDEDLPEDNSCQEEIDNQQRPKSRDSQSISARRKVNSTSIQQDHSMKGNQNEPQNRDFVKKQKTQNHEEQANFQQKVSEQQQNLKKSQKKLSLTISKQSLKQAGLMTQKNQDPQGQEQQLSQVQQSHHSIPIIVSKNDGTSQIINEEVQKQLADLYKRQNKQREEREKIIQNMMKSENEVPINEKMLDQKDENEQEYQEDEKIQATSAKKIENHPEREQGSRQIKSQKNNHQSLQQKQLDLQKSKKQVKIQQEPHTEILQSALKKQQYNIEQPQNQTEEQKNQLTNQNALETKEQQLNQLNSHEILKTTDDFEAALSTKQPIKQSLQKSKQKLKQVQEGQVELHKSQQDFKLIINKKKMKQQQIQQQQKQHQTEKKQQISDQIEEGKEGQKVKQQLEQQQESKIISTQKQIGQITLQKQQKQEVKQMNEQTGTFIKQQQEIDQNMKNQNQIISKPLASDQYKPQDRAQDCKESMAQKSIWMQEPNKMQKGKVSNQRSQSQQQLQKNTTKFVVNVANEQSFDEIKRNESQNGKKTNKEYHDENSSKQRRDTNQIIEKAQILKSQTNKAYRLSSQTPDNKASSVSQTKKQNLVDLETKKEKNQKQIPSQEQQQSANNKNQALSQNKTENKVENKTENKTENIQKEQNIHLKQIQTQRQQLMKTDPEDPSAKQLKQETTQKIIQDEIIQLNTKVAENVISKNPQKDQLVQKNDETMIQSQKFNAEKIVILQQEKQANYCLKIKQQTCSQPQLQHKNQQNNSEKQQQKILPDHYQSEVPHQTNQAKSQKKQQNIQYRCEIKIDEQKSKKQHIQNELKGQKKEESQQSHTVIEQRKNNANPPIEEDQKAKPAVKQNQQNQTELKLQIQQKQNIFERNDYNNQQISHPSENNSLPISKQKLKLEIEQDSQKQQCKEEQIYDQNKKVTPNFDNRKIRPVDQVFEIEKQEKSHQQIIKTQLFQEQTKPKIQSQVQIPNTEKQEKQSQKQLDVKLTEQPTQKLIRQELMNINQKIASEEEKAVETIKHTEDHSSGQPQSYNQEAKAQQ